MLNTVLVFSCVEVSSHYSTEEVWKDARIKELAINVEVCDGQINKTAEGHGIERTLLHLRIEFGLSGRILLEELFIRLLDCLFIDYVYIGGVLMLSEIRYVVWEYIEKGWTGESTKNSVGLSVYGIRTYRLHVQKQRETLLLEYA
jgi:hypothetical protein